MPGEPPVGAGLDEQVADRGRLDRPGEDGPAGQVGGELAQQRVGRTATDDVHDVGPATGERLGPLQGPSVLAREAVQHTPHQGGPADRHGCPADQRHAAVSCAGMSGGATNPGSSGSTRDRKPGTAAAAATRSA